MREHWKGSVYGKYFPDDDERSGFWVIKHHYWGENRIEYQVKFSGRVVARFNKLDYALAEAKRRDRKLSSGPIASRRFQKLTMSAPRRRREEWGEFERVVP